MQLTGMGVKCCSTSGGRSAIQRASMKYKWQTLEKVLKRCEF